MADREKLIDLLCKAKSKAIDEILSDDISYAQQLEIEADHLLANGVTFAKDTNVPSWIPVSERLPEDEEKVLALSKSSWSDGYLTWLIRYNHKKSAFYDYDAEWGDIKIHNVTHWMPLPDFPKEEKNNG